MLKYTTEASFYIVGKRTNILAKQLVYTIMLNGILVSSFFSKNVHCIYAQYKRSRSQTSDTTGTTHCDISTYLLCYSTTHVVFFSKTHEIPI